MTPAWCLGAAVALILIAMPRAAAAQTAEGEMLRFLRQAEAYYEQNSNRNVFRNSRHYSPTRNVMRSSRHYQQRLAASADGYPVRSFGQFTESINGESFVRGWSYAHPRGDRYRVRPGQASRAAALGGRSFHDVPVDEGFVDRGDGYDAEPLYADEPYAAIERPAPPRRPATERAVLERIVRADGTISTIIRSVPIEAVADRGGTVSSADTAADTAAVADADADRDAS